MMSIKKMNKPNMIKINNEMFQIINQTSLWYDRKKDEIEMVIELVKLKEKRLTSDYRLTYIHKKPHTMKFHVYNKNKKEWLEKEIKQIFYN